MSRKEQFKKVSILPHNLHRVADRASQSAPKTIADRLFNLSRNVKQLEKRNWPPPPRQGDRLPLRPNLNI